MNAVYIHIPFCERICSYCDFPKKVSKPQEITTYLEALEKEIKLYNVKENIKTLYLGGGTPSILNKDQFAILTRIIKQFNFASEYEFTIECNPEHINQERLNIFKQLGINRISLGVQTFNDRLLKLLNRGHNKDIVYNAIKLLKRNDFNNINIDLMFAIPFQTMELVMEDISHIKALDIPHVSYYSLILEEKTVFENWLEQGKIKLIDNEIEASMYEYIIKSLKEIGFSHYEISNFAKTNYQSKHNLVYWQNEHYYGFGMGASGYINYTRYYNENRVNSYIDKIKHNLLPIQSQDTLDKPEQIKEALLLGLRLLDGLSISDINNRYHIDVQTFFKEELRYLKEQGWIKIDTHIRLTHTGLFYGNEVFQLFV